MSNSQEFYSVQSILFAKNYDRSFKFTRVPVCNQSTG